MINPLVTSLEELSKVIFLAMRFIDAEDILEFSEEIAKLAIAAGFGARAKEAIDNAKREGCAACRGDNSFHWENCGCKCHKAITPREIKMAAFIAGDGLSALRYALGGIDATERTTRLESAISVCLQIAGDFAVEESEIIGKATK